MMFSDLPRDLQAEILSRVPARSLQKLKPTCKRWYTLFKDPGFLKKNLGRAERGLLMLMNSSRVCSISINLPGIHNSVDPSFDVTGVLVSKNDPEDVKISDIFQCNGLLLCTTTDRRLVVWNPYTGQTRWIPNRSSNALFHKFVLGYEQDSCSYKVLRYKSYDSLGPLGAEFEIYEFNSDSWCSFYDVSPNCSFESKGVSLKGNTYWIASDTEGPFGTFGLRFDFTTKKFGRFSLPFQSDDAGGVVDSMILSVVREEKLALLYERFEYFTKDPSEMKIWVTNTKIEEAKDLSWSDFLVVDFPKLMVTRMTNARSFLVDEEKKMVVFCDTDSDVQYRTRVYFVGENVYQEVYKETTTGESFCYWPRLVSPDSN
ncbi:PREDICTED: putative F-box/kelch-repeat protein At3g17570 [Camelina sativa]|uniref:F-box/kelch-repeat protein At3g17570 n=1 Tax=Camelina sativa TaxID=90675 RepID=A0ABM0XRL2_CAMSA|nr:PREDICTED: putative F-box/kelch-repeat protein At3g17570 [Camelina sativa]